MSYEEELIEGLNEDKYSLIILNHPLEDYESIKIFDENLYLSVPLNHEFASLKEISLEQLNGTSVLLRSKLGYWKTIKEKFIPDSQLLYQDDEIILNELIKHSSLPGFRTNISLQRLKEKEDRIIGDLYGGCGGSFYFFDPPWLVKKKKTRPEYLLQRLKPLSWSLT